MKDTFYIRSHEKLRMSDRARNIFLIILVAVLLLIFSLGIMGNAGSFVFGVMCMISFGGLFVYLELYAKMPYLEMSKHECRYRNLVGSVSCFDLYDIVEISYERCYFSDPNTIKIVSVFNRDGRRLAMIRTDMNGIDTLTEYLVQHIPGSQKYNMGWINPYMIQLEDMPDCLLLECSVNKKWKLILTSGSCIYDDFSGGRFTFDLKDVIEVSECKSRQRAGVRSYILLKSGRRVADIGYSHQMSIQWKKVKPFVMHQQKKRIVDGVKLEEL